MKSKDYIEDKLNTGMNKLENLYTDINNNKPHVTKEYILERLNVALSDLKSASLRLELED